MIRRILSTLLIAQVLAGLAGCGSKAPVHDTGGLPPHRVPENKPKTK